MRASSALRPSGAHQGHEGAYGIFSRSFHTSAWAGLPQTASIGEPVRGLQPMARARIRVTQHGEHVVDKLRALGLILDDTEVVAGESCNWPISDDQGW
jgi:hypothetical protein